MSANLLADLDSFYGGQAASESRVSSAAHEAPVSDDDFGDFEGPEATSPTPPTASAKHVEYNAWADLQWSSSTAAQAKSTTSRGLNIPERAASSDISHRRRPTTQSSKTRDESILFDADDDDNGDDDDYNEKRDSIAHATVPQSPGPVHQVKLNPIEKKHIWVPETRKPPQNLLDLDAGDTLSVEQHASNHWHQEEVPNDWDWDTGTTEKLQSVSSPVQEAATFNAFVSDNPKVNAYPDTSSNGGDTSHKTHDVSQQVAALTVKAQSTQSIDQPMTYTLRQKSRSQAREATSARQQNEHELLRIPAQRISQSQILEQEDNVDAWDDFDDTLPSTETRGREDAGQASAVPTHLQPVAVGQKMEPSSSRLLAPVSAIEKVPPTNIPPPSVLLGLFSPIFNAAQKDLSHSVTEDYLLDYLSIVVTCARVISGRKLRWKRDAILAQSMRIGPASTSGRSGGMKLAGVDKGENAKEEREVADVVLAWKRQAGKLRVAASSFTGLPSIPVLNDAIPVRLAAASEGGLTSPKPCVLCGLKRNERANQVDSNIQDSFGEWWQEHWGHVGCARFWYNHKDHLASR